MCDPCLHFHFTAICFVAHQSKETCSLFTAISPTSGALKYVAKHTDVSGMVKVCVNLS